MLHLKNISKWSRLAKLDVQLALLSQDIVNLESQFLQSNITEISYRRQKAILENQINDTVTEQNILRAELYVRN